MPVSVSYCVSSAPCSDSNKVKGGAPCSDSNKVKGGSPLWGQFFICKIKNGGLDNEKRSEAPVASAIAAGFLVDSG